LRGGGKESPGELNENGRRLFRPSKAGFWGLNRLFMALGLVGAPFFIRRNTCTAWPSLGTRLDQTWEPNRPVPTILLDQGQGLRVLLEAEDGADFVNSESAVAQQEAAPFTVAGLRVE